jgi:hypothetical protein
VTVVRLVAGGAFFFLGHIGTSRSGRPNELILPFSYCPFFADANNTEFKANKQLLNFAKLLFSTPLARRSNQDLFRHILQFVKAFSASSERIVPSA